MRLIELTAITILAAFTAAVLVGCLLIALGAV